MITHTTDLERAQAAEIERLRAALNKIASWHEGPVVTGAFDEPHSAMTARAALGAQPAQPAQRLTDEQITQAIATTRAQRRELERQNAKMPRGLRLVPRDEWPLRLQSAPVLRVWRSRDFLVQEYAEAAPVLVRLSVLRTTLDPAVGRWVDGITWEELQGIKSECGYGQHDALEIYPVEGDVVNVANLRHLWVMRAMVTFAWRATPAAGREAT